MPVVYVIGFSEGAGGDQMKYSDVEHVKFILSSISVSTIYPTVVLSGTSIRMQLLNRTMCMNLQGTTSIMHQYLGDAFGISATVYDIVDLLTQYYKKNICVVALLDRKLQTPVANKLSEEIFGWGMKMGKPRYNHDFSISGGSVGYIPSITRTTRL